MTNDKRKTPAETPRFEPEILPPERGKAAGAGDAAWTQWESQGVHHIHIGKIGPFRFMLWALIAVVIIASVLILFAGALLVVVPVAAALVGGSIIAARLRRVFRR